MRLVSVGGMKRRPIFKGKAGPRLAWAAAESEEKHFSKFFDKDPPLKMFSNLSTSIAIHPSSGCGELENGYPLRRPRAILTSRAIA